VARGGIEPPATDL